MVSDAFMYACFTTPYPILFFLHWNSIVRLVFPPEDIMLQFAKTRNHLGDTPEYVSLNWVFETAQSDDAR